MSVIAPKFRLGYFLKGIFDNAFWILTIVTLAGILYTFICFLAIGAYSFIYLLIFCSVVMLLLESFSRFIVPQENVRRERRNKAKNFINLFLTIKTKLCLN